MTSPKVQSSLLKQRGNRQGGSTPAAAPVNSVAPVLTGNAALGHVLSLGNGTWLNTPTSYAYSYYRDGVVIAGQTGATYTSVNADIGHTVTGQIVASNAGGHSSPVSSNGITITNAAQSAGPGPSWNGTAGSGFAGSPPVDPTRTTAKPRLRSWTVDQQRFVGTFRIGVYASAEGGLSVVKCYIEGNEVDVTVLDVNTYTNLNGGVNTEVGYFVDLTAADFTAVSATGTAQIYWEAVPADGTMQHRVIGPLTFFPRTVMYDWVKTFGAGGDYATPVLAMNALAAAYNANTAECGNIRAMASGSYDLVDTASSNANHSKGYTYIDALPGVVATLHRGASFDPNNTGGVWTWQCPLDNIAIGPGIVIDIKNFQTIRPTSLRPWWLRGGKFTNSIGTRDTLYWNKGPHPGFLLSFSSQSDVPLSWSDDCLSEFCGSPFGQITYDPAQPGIVKKFANSNNVLGGVYFDAPFVANCYENGSSCLFYRVVKQMFSVSFGGSGTAAYRIDHPGGITFTLIHNGADVQSWTLGQNPAGGIINTSSGLVSAINSYANGFSAALIDDTYAVTACAGAGSGVVIPLSTTPTVQSGFFDFHTEWYHAFFSGPLQNVVMLNNNVMNAGYSTTLINSETGFADAEFVNNSGIGFLNSPNGFGNSHVTVRNNYCPNGVTLYDSNVDPYSRFAGNLFGPMYTYSGTWPLVLPIRDNIWQLGWQGAPVGSNYSGNTVVADISTCVTNANVDDLRPAGAALTHLCAPGLIYDQNNNIRATLDAPGPIAIGYPARVYPF